jgi:hypothetical protein
MEEIKNIVDDLGNDSLENSINLAGVAVVADSGDVVFQTSNWDLASLTNAVKQIINGDPLFIMNDVEFTIVETTSEGIIATNKLGMGHVLFVPFQGGVLLSYAMPQANPPKALAFLKTYAMRLNGKIKL